MVAPPPNPPNKPVSYPRPPLLNSPIRAKYGLGKLTTKNGEVYIGSMGGAGQKNVPVTTFDVIGAFAALSPPAQKALYNSAGRVYGYENVPQINMDGFLADTAKKAYAVQQTTGMLVDPLSYWDYYETTGGPGLKDFGADGAAGGAGGAGGGPKTTTSRSESVNLADPSTARGLIDATIAQYLGRNPTDTEYANFTAALNAAQKKNPSITQSVTTSGGGTSSSRSMTKGGMDEAQFAREYAQSQEGVAELSAATTGLDSFIDAIGGF
jgi:hypothetical protein